MKKSLFLLFFLGMVTGFLFGENISRSELNLNFIPDVSDEFAAAEGVNYEIKLLTAAPGKSLMELYFWWGHTALIVEDKKNGRMKIYDYGVFSMPENQILLNFMGGRIDYIVNGSTFYSYDQVLYPFVRNNRWAVLQTLDFDLAATYRVAKYLEHNSKRGNNVYEYHFFYENCSTKIRDLINYGVGGQLYEKLKAPSKKTLRQIHRQYLQESFMADWALQFLLSGAEVDRPSLEWDNLFLPFELMNAVQAFSYVDSAGNRRELVKEREETIPPTVGRELLRMGIPSSAGLSLGDPTRIETKPSLTWLLALFTGIGVGATGALLFLLGTRSRVCRILGGIFTSVISLLLFVLSSILFYMAFFSSHDVTYVNVNLILINPISMLVAFFLSLFYAGNVGKSRIAYAIFWMILAGIALLLLILKLFGVYEQDNLMILSAFLPFFILMATSGFFKNRFTK